MFNERFRDGYPVVGRGSPTYLIQDYKAPACSVRKHIGNVEHLVHEGGNPHSENVSRAYPCKEGVYIPDPGLLSGNEAPHVGEQHYQGHLPYVTGLAGHVRASYYMYELVFGQVRVVGNVVPRELLYDGMSAFLYVYIETLVDLRFYPIPLRSHLRKGLDVVYLPHQLGVPPYPLQLSVYPLSKLNEQLVLELVYPALGREYLLLEPAEFFCSKSFCVREGLSPPEVFGNVL